MSSPMPLQDRTDISQQAATTSWPPLKDATVNALKYLRPKAMKEQYITAKDRANLKITCGQLDFGSAKSRFGKQNIQFLELMSVEDMKKLANEHNLQQADQLDPIWLPPRFDTACDVFDIFNGHLDCFYNGANLVHRSLWECREPESFEERLLQVFKETAGCMWQIQCIELPKDRSKPHINAFLADDASLKEDTLLFSEVWCILMLTLRKLSRFGPFNVVPVTIISASGRQVRIVQGYVDNEAGINISKTPIVTLDPRGKGCQTELFTLLRWFLATPVTKKW